MEHLIKTIARNQKLQDIGAVLRGADRVFSVYWRHMGKNILYPLVISFGYSVPLISLRIPVNQEVSNIITKKKSSKTPILIMIPLENLILVKINLNL